MKQGFFGLSLGSPFPARKKSGNEKSIFYLSVSDRLSGSGFAVLGIPKTGDAEATALRHPNGIAGQIEAASSGHREWYARSAMRLFVKRRSLMRSRSVIANREKQRALRRNFMNGTDQEPMRTIAASDPFSVKNVLVIMSFGGNDILAERRSIVEFLRIKYIIENKIDVRQKKSDPNSKVLFEANVYKAEVGSIPDDAIDRIAEADIVVALITGMNINVIYEMAVRNVFRAEFVIIIKGDPKDVLPIYMQGIAYITWAKYEGIGEQRDLGEHGKKIESIIKQLAAMEQTDLDFNSTIDQIPPSLKRAVDEHDRELIADLQRSFEKNVSIPPPKTLPFLQKHVGSRDPGRLLDDWTQYVPLTIVRIKWKRQSGVQKYEPEDMIGEPVVYQLNDQYAKIFDFARANLPDPNGERPLTIGRLIDQVSDYVDPADLEIFNKDQAEISDKVIFRNAAFSSAKVPLRFNEHHPSEEVRGKSYLPVLLSRKQIGDLNHPHLMFLAIVMIPGPWSRS